jgi:phosphopantothenoylcysteine synthetase/decarboxylase
MRILVTAGNTLVPVDRVRCLTNIFTGRTGARIAWCAHERKHTVTLLTSRPEALAEVADAGQKKSEVVAVQTYSTFDDLERLFETALRQDKPDAVIHCAAVSDFRVDGAYAPAPGTHFVPERGHWETSENPPPAMTDRRAGKLKSDEPELWLRLVRTPKLIDRIRSDWDFRGVLVKFKLEVDVGDERLLDVAEHSRRQSAADFMVANTLEGAESWAYLGPIAGTYYRLTRQELPGRLIGAIEQLHQEKSHA